MTPRLPSMSTNMTPAAVLASARSYPRPVVERLVSRLIEHMDEQDARTEDSEEDDPPEDEHDAEALGYNYHPLAPLVVSLKAVR